MNYYWGVIVGCYAVVWVESIGGAVTWLTPIFWAAWFAIIEGIAWLVRRAWRKRKESRLTRHSSPAKQLSAPSDTTARNEQTKPAGGHTKGEA